MKKILLLLTLTLIGCGKEPSPHLDQPTLMPVAENTTGFRVYVVPIVGSPSRTCLVLTQWHRYDQYDTPVDFECAAYDSSFYFKP